MKAKKTNPKSIRFNIKDLDAGISKSKLDSPQELVDFLLSNYVREEVKPKSVPQELPEKEMTKAEILKAMFKK